MSSGNPPAFTGAKVGSATPSSRNGPLECAPRMSASTVRPDCAADPRYLSDMAATPNWTEEHLAALLEAIRRDLAVITGARE